MPHFEANRHQLLFWIRLRGLARGREARRFATWPALDWCLKKRLLSKLAFGLPLVDVLDGELMAKVHTATFDWLEMAVDIAGGSPEVGITTAPIRIPRGLDDLLLALQLRRQGRVRHLLLEALILAMR